ncbi:centromere-associated protein E-like [Maniola hyperantus]|uniref:centromere-associated protein E-like n=1 Tax=Aphantopus hyperantus TaxID=2795564 RepID=UPI0015683238|nr:uncharacterized protein LOC117996746 [Maniola hyperantus]
MSLCNTFRLSVLCFTFVLWNIDVPVAAFTLRRTTRDIDSYRDLAQEESVLLEVKRELNVPDKIQITENNTTEHINNNNNFTFTSPIVELERDVITEPDSNNYSDDRTTSLPNETLVPEQSIIADKVITTESIVDVINTELQTITTDSILENTSPLFVDKITDTETTTNLIDVTILSEIDINEPPTMDVMPLNKTNIEESNQIKNKQEFSESESNVTEKATNNVKEQKHLSQSPKKSRPIPKWKKYKIIERKRPLISSAEKLKERKKEDNVEDILKAETKHVRVTLQDTVTSDIPSLESLKNDLLSSTLKLQTLESKSSVALKSLVTEQNISTPISLTPTETISAVGHESKRAGFLNYSGQTTTADFITDMTTSEITTESLNAEVTTEMSDLKTTDEPQTKNLDIDVQEDKSKIGSLIVLNEDAIKEELLKEELINNQENAKHQREELANKSDFTEMKNRNPENSAEINLSSELSVKPVNSDRSKNSSLYTVNPNYKPMKKIEVVPPKQFVRDPDDNSWRNESLSSLGIVFKPKNSSKPFTQVLKNKTETEWNNLSEKDIKNDLPDLRERLQKMAEKRKSKRKKIDSFGNVVYFDYEENSSSAEHAGITIDELTSTVTTYSPALQSTNQTKLNSSLITEGFNKISYSTRKPNKFFHEYYDSTDEDDSDYLNMAQIDLKKFTTSLRPSTPFHPATIIANQPDWLKNSNKLSNNAFPERKATVQYFPPLTTKKVNVNEYDNGFNFKMESFTTETDEPKLVSIDRPTTPVTVNTVASTSDYTRNLILSQPHLTTDPSVALIDDGSFDRGTYVIKHYKDFLHEAAKDAEYDKNLGYEPYTEAPVEGVTKADFIRYDKEKPRTIDSGYPYEPPFRKDVLQRFVDDFNHNSERYRSDFPIIFNSSIVHGGMQHGRDLASSRAFMRSSYNSDIFKPKIPSQKSCEPNCEKITVELSPAYELHYYVPDQEEKEEAVPQPVTLPYKYSL